MAVFLVRRLASMVVVLGVLTALMFALQNISPIDPVRVLLGDRTPEETVQAERERLGYNDPLPVRYLRYVGEVANGSLGVSLRTKQPVMSDIQDFLPASLELALFSALLGIPLAALFALSSAARWRGGGFFRGGLLTFAAAPPFLLGILSIIVFFKHLGWFPASGRSSIGDAPIGPTGLLTIDGLLAGRPAVSWDAVRHLVLPGFSLALLPAIAVGRILRGSLIDNLRSDHVRAAKSRGLTDWQLMSQHCLRNSAGPTLAMSGLLLGLIFGGLTVLELTFGRAGIGLYVAQSVPKGDFPAISGVTLLIGASYVVINTVVDLLQAAADPRIRT